MAYRSDPTGNGRHGRRPSVDAMHGPAIVPPETPRPGVPAATSRHRRALLDSTEARVLACGVGLALLTVVMICVGWLLDPGATAVFAAMTGLNLTVGRAAGMSFGYANGLDHAAVISSNVIVETIQVLIVYPLFVLSWNNLVEVRRMRRVLAGMRRSAEASQARVARYGMLGLFAFVFLPFWMTGPVVGAIIGFLIGLRPRQILVTVLAGTYAAVLVWAVFFERLNAWLADYGRYAVFGTVVLLAVAALALRESLAWRQRQPTARPIR